MSVPDETSVALAVRNLIVREMGECTLPLLVIHKAIQEADRVRAELSAKQS